MSRSVRVVVGRIISLCDEGAHIRSFMQAWAEVRIPGVSRCGYPYSAEQRLVAPGEDLWKPVAHAVGERGGALLQERGHALACVVGLAAEEHRARVRPVRLHRVRGAEHRPQQAAR